MAEQNEHFLKKFLEPESVAVIGASNNRFSINRSLVANLINLGYKGKIYPVNLKEPEILGLKAYASVSDIPDPVDLAVISVPGAMAPEVLRECARKGIRRVTMTSGGFSETGEKGRSVQEEMAGVIRGNGMRAIGPNALSPINVPGNFYISFQELKPIKPGGLSLVFQSGLYEPRIDWLTTSFNLHLNKLIDLGNKMDINEVDALTYLADDPLTRVIAIHLESMPGGGKAFLEAVRRATGRGKRVVVLKSGRTSAGAVAAASHTGALVRGSDRVIDGALRQCGALRVETLADFFDLAKALERMGPVSMEGDRLFLAAIPGGEAVIVTDMCEQGGLRLAQVGEETLNRLRTVFPPWEIRPNPWDLGLTMQFRHPAEVVTTLVDAVLADPGVDALALQFPPWALFFGKEHFQVFERAAKAGKPIVLWMAGEEPGRFELLEWLEELHIPVFSAPEKAIGVLLALRRLSRMRSSQPCLGPRFPV
jgi:acyl-CoA synthetase (NDP forming)